MLDEKRPLPVGCPNAGGRFEPNEDQRECQLPSLKTVAEGKAPIPPQPFIIHLKWFLMRHLSPSQVMSLRRYVDKTGALLASLTGQEKPAAPARPVIAAAPAEPIQAGDLVRVRAKADIMATLDSHGKLKGCAYMDAMAPYCGTEQRVLKVMERFVDEREMRVKKCKGLVLLEGVMCEGTTRFGRCDRCCFMFWREEWLEKLK